MKDGSAKYRLMMRALDDAGQTVNILRIAPGWYELHLNYEIIRKARKRETCNRHLTRLAKKYLPPPIYNSSNQTTPMFFQSLSEITPRLDFTMRVMSADNGTLTVSITPAAVDKMRPMLLTATPTEMDEKFIEAIRTPVELAAQLDTSEYEEELRQKVKEKRLQTEVKVEKEVQSDSKEEKKAEAPIPAKKSSSKSSGGSKKATAVKNLEPPAATEPAESVINQGDSGMKSQESGIKAPIGETSASDGDASADKNEQVEEPDTAAPPVKYEAQDRVIINKGDNRGKVGTVLSGLEAEGKIVIDLDFGGGKIGVNVSELSMYKKHNEPEPEDEESEGLFVAPVKLTDEELIAKINAQTAYADMNKLFNEHLVQIQTSDKLYKAYKSKSDELLDDQTAVSEIIDDMELLNTNDELTRFTTAHKDRFDKHVQLQEAYNAKRSELNQKEIAAGENPKPQAPARPAPPRPMPPRPAPATA